MKYLILADTHFTDAPRDAYRFSIFAWLERQQAKYNVDATFILGDLTDRKDHHSSVLVNRITDGLIGLKPPVHILKGNHDYVDPANPFFGFLGLVDGIDFIVEPTWFGSVAMIPHYGTQDEFDRACAGLVDFPGVVMLHGCFAGAIGESGRHLSGLSLALVEKAKPKAIYAGDIHKPQRVGPLTYVGAPYHVRFGDDYIPRVLLVDDGKERDLHFPAPRKLLLEVSDISSLPGSASAAGDQVKIKVRLRREEATHWARHRQMVLDACKEHGLEVHGISLIVDAAPQRQVPAGKRRTNKEILEAYCKAEDLPDTLAASGAKLLDV